MLRENLAAQLLRSATSQCAKRKPKRTSRCRDNCSRCVSSRLPLQLAMNKCTLSILLLSTLPAMCAFGGVRHFTFLYEAPTSPPGSIELENTVTWAHRSNLNDAFVREELEIGITDRFQ